MLTKTWDIDPSLDLFPFLESDPISNELMHNKFHQTILPLN